MVVHFNLPKSHKATAAKTVENSHGKLNADCFGVKHFYTYYQSNKHCMNDPLNVKLKDFM